MLCDGDVVETTNLNRLVGGNIKDVADKRLKVEIAERIILGQHDLKTTKPHIELVASRWQENALPLRTCDIIFGCVDGFAERRDLEAMARRYLIPLIDIGMGVQPSISGQPPRMAGQVILSMPGDLCMTCMGFLNDKNLAQEAAKYGATGDRPQVVWPNGVLASTAVGIAVDLLTDWTRSLRHSMYLSYDGNLHVIQPHVRLQHLKSKTCDHFQIQNLGDPIFRPL